MQAIIKFADAAFLIIQVNSKKQHRHYKAMYDLVVAYERHTHTAGTAASA